MDWAALIIGAGGALVAGAIGCAVAFAVQRFWHIHVPLLWAGAGGAAVGLLLTAAVIGGWFSSALSWSREKVAVDDVLPYMQQIKAREPALYERIETSVIRDEGDGVGIDDVRANAKTLVMSYVADKTPFLPDQLTYELFATTRDQLAYMAEQNDHQACADLALGRAKGDIDAHLSPELIERGNNNTVHVLEAPTDQNAAKMPAEQFTQLATHSFAEAAQTTRIPVEEIDNILAGKSDSAKACKLMKAFFDGILAQPVEVAATALRALSSGERSPTQ